MNEPQAPASPRLVPWSEYVRPYANPGLSSCITDGMLRLDGVPVAATWIDVVATRLVEWAVAKRQTLVLLTPDPYDLLIPLTAAAVHVARIIELGQAAIRRGQQPPPTDARVAVVTKRMRLRTAYRRLSLHSAKLFEAVPAATRLPTGGIAVLGSGNTRINWGTLFVERASDLRNVKGLTLVVADLPLYDWSELNALAVPKIVVGHDPSDRLIYQLASANTPIYAWNADDLRGLKTVTATQGTALAAVAARLERLAAGVTCVPVAVVNNAVSENAALFWSDIGSLHRAAHGSYLAHELTREGHELFYDLLHLTVPVPFFEQQTGTSFRARLRGLNHDEFKTQGDLRDKHIPQIHVALRDLAGTLGENPPKCDALLRFLRGQIDKGRSTVIVARSATMARVQQSYLAQFPELRSVRVTSLAEVGQEMPADVAVLTGLAPAWARQIYSSGIAREVHVLAYAAERTLVVPDPFIEAEYVQRAIAYQRTYGAWLARAALKARCWKALSGNDLGIVDDEPYPPKIDSGEVRIGSVPPPPDVPPGLWEIDMSWLDRSEGEREGGTTTSAGDRDVSIHGVRLTFDDGRWVFLDRDGIVTRYKLAAQEAEPGVNVSDVRPGDQIVFLDGDARKDILGKVLEVAKEIPQLATAATWVEYWRDALRRAKQRYKTYEFMADRLHARGCRRETQTIRLWVIGATIGPQDPMDVKRVGQALEDVPLRDHHDVVYAGIEGFRKAHAQLMERLGTLAVQVGPTAHTRPDQIIDERSGLTAADFQGCVEILRVRTVAPAGVMPLAAVGRLRRLGDAKS